MDFHGFPGYGLDCVVDMELDVPGDIFVEGEYFKEAFLQQGPVQNTRVYKRQVVRKNKNKNNNNNNNYNYAYHES